MKGKRIAFASTLCIASLMVSGANAVKPDNPGKPDKPPKTSTELIAFTGDDLHGWAHVAGCCPNAGPDPEYTMVLPYGLKDSAGYEVYPPGPYDGFLFMNGYSAGGVSGYIVQFWASRGGDEPLTFEIICGTTVYDRKTKVLRVTCNDEPWWKDYNRDIDMGLVSFEITRVATRYCTDDICTEPQY